MSDVPLSFRLDGRKAIVTGGAGEIGIALAQALQQFGADVALIDVTANTPVVAAELSREGKTVAGVVADLADPEATKAGFDKAVAALGGLDILVNAAGIQRRNPAIDFPAKDWDDVMRVNLGGTFYISQNAGRLMIEQRRGKIINIASMSSYFGMKFISAYVASKGGIMQLTKALSNEWAEYGIQVNAIAPGFIRTRMNAAYFEPAGKELHDGITRRIPSGRWGLPADLQGALIFLASPASDYVTGVTLPVDGGYVGR